MARSILARYQRLKGEQIAEMLEIATGPEAQEVVVTWLDEIELRGHADRNALALHVRPARDVATLAA